MTYSEKLTIQKRKIYLQFDKYGNWIILHLELKPFVDENNNDYWLEEQLDEFLEDIKEHKNIDDKSEGSHYGNLVLEIKTVNDIDGCDSDIIPYIELDY